jgi:hypothetical protein
MGNIAILLDSGYLNNVLKKCDMWNLADERLEITANTLRQFIKK